MDSTRSEIAKKLEEDIANLLLDKLEDNELTLERAQLIAQFCLAHIPEHITDEQLFTLLPTLDDEFIELAGVVYKYIALYEKEHAKILAHQMGDLIKHQHFDEASSMATDYFQKKFI